MDLGIRGRCAIVCGSSKGLGRGAAQKLAEAGVRLTRAFVSTPRGPHPILLLACAAVATEERGRGIGTSLIETAFRRARNLGHKAIVLVGDPTFYSRFGFQPSVRFGITNANGLEHEHVQIRELFPGALRNVSGAILLPT